LARGIKPIVIAAEFVQRKNFVPLVKHRPDNALPLSLSDFCRNLNLDLHLTSRENLHQALSSLGKIDAILLTTGMLIEAQTAKKYKMINAHPGYLPLVKGLDALKWAILYGQKIGVTSHFINEEVDGGIIIERKEVPVYYEDTFHNLAYRQYEMEIDMTISALDVTPLNEPIGESSLGTFRRMPHRLEPRMMEAFEQLRKQVPIIRNMTDGD
jgi:phosphoribosylglycinamide formyltransferase-1